MSKTTVPAVQRPRGTTERRAGLPDQQLPIRVYQDGDQYTAVIDILHLASCGETPEAACEALREAVAEYTEFLAESEPSLGPDLREQLRILRGAAL